MVSPYYINLLGKYGNRFLDYATMEDLLSHMDRLGIWQTTATRHIGNSAECNQAMIHDLERVPGAKERIIPAFVADPHIYITEGLMEHLTMCLTKYRPACLRLMPKTKVYRLREIEQVLVRLEYLHPVILIERSEMNDVTDFDDLLLLAKRFPTMRFVIQKVMWNPLHLVLDVMERAENICIDCGFMHMQGGFVTLSKLFGMERILFSLGLRANHGAAISALNWARIPQAHKDSIASDNFINLFHDAQDREILRSNRRTIANQVKNSYWNRHLAGEPLGTQVIDAHGHILPPGSQWLSPLCNREKLAALMVEDMDRLGIARTYVSNTIMRYEDALYPNRELMEVATPYKDRFRGYLLYFANFPELYTEEYLDKMFSTGFYVGLKSLPKYQEVSIDDPRYEPMFRYAHEHHLPILLHTWDGMPFGNVRACAEVAKKWPNAKVIMGHSGGIDAGRNVCLQIAKDPAYDNVYFDFCGSFLWTKDWQSFIEQVDYHRVLFGSDSHVHDQAFELGRLLSEDIPDEILQAILAENALRILGK